MDDDFGDFGSLKKKQTPRGNIDFGVDQNDGSGTDLHKLIKKESTELFGLFPSKENLDGKYMLLSVEIVRIH